MPVTSAAPSATAAAPTAGYPQTPGPTEQVVRPSEGLARGIWEAPPVAFYAAAGALLVSCGLYAARRAGRLTGRRPRP